MDRSMETNAEPEIIGLRGHHQKDGLPIFTTAQKYIQFTQGQGNLTLKKVEDMYIVASVGQNTKSEGSAGSRMTGSSGVSRKSAKRVHKYGDFYAEVKKALTGKKMTFNGIGELPVMERGTTLGTAKLVAKRQSLNLEVYASHMASFGRVKTPSSKSTYSATVQGQTVDNVITDVGALAATLNYDPRTERAVKIGVAFGDQGTKYLLSVWHQTGVTVARQAQITPRGFTPKHYEGVPARKYVLPPRRRRWVRMGPRGGRRGRARGGPYTRRGGRGRGGPM